MPAATTDQQANFIRIQLVLNNRRNSLELMKVRMICRDKTRNCFLNDIFRIINDFLHPRNILSFVIYVKREYALHLTGQQVGSPRFDLFHELVEPHRRVGKKPIRTSAYYYLVML